MGTRVAGSERGPSPVVERVGMEEELRVVVEIRGERRPPCLTAALRDRTEFGICGGSGGAGAPAAAEAPAEEALKSSSLLPPKP